MWHGENRVCSQDADSNGVTVATVASDSHGLLELARHGGNGGEKPGTVRARVCDWGWEAAHGEREQSQQAAYRARGSKGDDVIVWRERACGGMRWKF